MLEIKIAEEKDSPLWDSLVENSPNGTLFHTWRFLKIIERHTGSKLYPLLGLNGSNPVGVYPLFFQKKFITRLVLSPPSHALLLYLGPAFAGYGSLKQSAKESLFFEFQEKVNSFISRELKYSYVRVRTSPELVDSRPFIWTGYAVDPLCTFTLDIRDAETVWNSFEKKVRLDISKTQREGVTVRDGSKEDLDLIRQSLADRFTEQGYTSKDYTSYLHEIYDSFHSDNLKIFIAEYKGKKVSGSTMICYRKRASLWIGIPKTTLKGIYPNDLIVWESIKWASENGYETFEIMCSGDDPRLRHFKSKFNSVPSIWYSAERYASPKYVILEKLFRLGQKLRMKK